MVILFFQLHSIRDGKCTCGNADCGSPGKHPRTKNGFKDATVDLRQIDAAWTDCPDANIGIATEASGLVVFDVDDPKGGSATLNALATKNGALPEVNVVKTGNGRHIWLAKPEGCGFVKSSKNDGGLDVRADGGYVVAPPSLHYSGQRYEWERRGTLVNAPPWALDWANRGNGAARSAAIKTKLGELPDYLKSKTSPVISERAAASLRTAWSPSEQAWIESALQAIPSDSYDTWYQIGMALQALRWETNETDIGFELWDRWSQGAPAKYSSAACESKWKSFGRDGRAGITIGTIYHIARQNGWTGPPVTEQSAQQVNGQLFAPFFGATESSLATLKAVSADQLLSAPAPARSWVVDRFLPAAEVTMLGGDGGTGKTTLALQLGISCVSGDGWLGLPVNRCNVIYVSAEDPEAEVHYRLEQITKHSPVASDELRQFNLIDMAGKDATLAFFDKGLLKPTQLLTRIEDIAREHCAGCLVFDSVADFFGGNENERREVRAFVGLLRGLAMRLNDAVVFLAHPSVDGIKTGRGYSV